MQAERITDFIDTVMDCTETQTVTAFDMKGSVTVTDGQISCTATDIQTGEELFSIEMDTEEATATITYTDNQETFAAVLSAIEEIGFETDYEV